MFFFPTEKLLGTARDSSLTTVRTVMLAVLYLRNSSSGPAQKAPYLGSAFLNDLLSMRRTLQTSTYLVKYLSQSAEFPVVCGRETGVVLLEVCDAGPKNPKVGAELRNFDVTAI